MPELNSNIVPKFKHCLAFLDKQKQKVSLNHEASFFASNRLGSFWSYGAVVRKWISFDAGIALFWVWYLPLFDQILDLVPQPDTSIRLVPTGLMKFAISFLIVVAGHCIRWSRIQWSEKAF